MTRVVLAILISLWIHGVNAESFEFAGMKRSYSLFVPTSSSAAPAPLIVLLHGSYGNAAAIVSWWTSLAEQEGIVLVAPDAREREAWQLRADGPQFIRAVIDEVAVKHPIDRGRIYLFGSSGGAVYSLTLSMIESQLFAATAIHAGAWRAPNEFRAVPYAKRKIPDRNLHRRQGRVLSDVRSTQDAERAREGRSSGERHSHPPAQARRTRTSRSK